MSVKADVQELEGVKAELKSVNTRAKSLRQRKKDLEDRITEYIKLKNLPGVKYQGKEYRLEEKQTRAPKKAKERDDDAIDLLRSEGIRDPKGFLSLLLESRKGDLVQTKKMQIKNLKQEQF